MSRPRTVTGRSGRPAAPVTGQASLVFVTSRKAASLGMIWRGSKGCCRSVSVSASCTSKYVDTTKRAKLEGQWRRTRHLAADAPPGHPDAPPSIIAVSECPRIGP